MEVGCCHSPLKRSWIMLKYQPNCDMPPAAPEPLPVAPAPFPVPATPVPPLPGGPGLVVLPTPGLAAAPVLLPGVLLGDEAGLGEALGFGEASAAALAGEVFGVAAGVLELGVASAAGVGFGVGFGVGLGVGFG